MNFRTPERQQHVAEKFVQADAKIGELGAIGVRQSETLREVTEFYREASQFYPDAPHPYIHGEVIREGFRSARFMVWSVGRAVVLLSALGMRHAQLAAMGLHPQQARHMVSPQED